MGLVSCTSSGGAVLCLELRWTKGEILVRWGKKCPASRGGKRLASRAFPGDICPPPPPSPPPLGQILSAVPGQWGEREERELRGSRLPAAVPLFFPSRQPLRFELIMLIMLPFGDVYDLYPTPILGRQTTTESPSSVVLINVVVYFLVSCTLAVWKHADNVLLSAGSLLASPSKLFVARFAICSLLDLPSRCRPSPRLAVVRMTLLVHASGEGGVDVVVVAGGSE
ncbi:hypothetical protein GGR56DRAFT_138786 [Xylariaceae sp. FL0804]|nr:hypothetical protein GGR56DRAFT_138786 [Xylariaceae sp. FL0804]